MVVAGDASMFTPVSDVPPRNVSCVLGITEDNSPSAYDVEAQKHQYAIQPPEWDPSTITPRSRNRGYEANIVFTSRRSYPSVCTSILAGFSPKTPVHDSTIQYVYPGLSFVPKINKPKKSLSPNLVRLSVIPQGLLCCGHAWSRLRLNRPSAASRLAH